MDYLDKQNRDFPLKIKIGFKKVFDAYRQQQKSDSKESTGDEILRLEKKYPELASGFESWEKLEDYKEQVNTLLQPLFPPLFGDNEIKFATVPFHDVVLKSSLYYQKLIDAAGKGFYSEFIDLDDTTFYILGCSLILSQYYGRDLDLDDGFHCNIPNENGLIQNYRVLYNIDFGKITKSSEAPDLDEKDFDELLESFGDIAVWKEKFPPQSYVFNGFVLARLIDVTTDMAISNFKTNLLRFELNRGFENTEFTEIFRSIFNLKDLKIGFTDYNEETQSFERILFKEINSFLLDGDKTKLSRDALCSTSHYTLFKQNEYYIVTDVARYRKLYPDNILYKKLMHQGIESAIFASIIAGGTVMGVMELVSPNKNDLNTINANKLKNVMPFLVDSVVRAKRNLENELELIVQEECTSIHNSVHWKFKKEAKRYLEAITEGNPTFFREVVFRNVHPLYGQVDIKGSSEARNEATQKDLAEQLMSVMEVVKKLHAAEPMAIFEQMEFEITRFLSEIKENLQVDTERKIVGFLASDIIPFFSHLSKTREEHRELINQYNSLIDQNTGLIYKHRREYDEAVMQANKVLAGVLDREQVRAQQAFPHYFERFKTDGVEHNLYIGASITNKKVYDPIYLRNLKLWQLQVIWEMENTYFRLKDQLAVKLEVASLILAFNGSLSLRFRMDEKRFDVDGTYNARYEVVKKRVDKAHIKGTDERITQPGKLVIVYSQKEDEEEYTTYIKFLQSQKLLDNDIETVELEDLQGVTGLKAIRVSFLYSKNNKKSKEYYTYEDLISEIHH